LHVAVAVAVTSEVPTPNALAKNRRRGLPDAWVRRTVTRTALLDRLAGAGVVKVAVFRFQ